MKNGPNSKVPASAHVFIPNHRMEYGIRKACIKVLNFDSYLLAQHGQIAPQPSPVLQFQCRYFEHSSLQ